MLLKRNIILFHHKNINHAKPILLSNCFFVEHRTRDEMCAPMGSDQAGAANLKYLLTATEMFQKWRNLRNNDLTSQTFTACIQTMGAFRKF